MRLLAAVLAPVLLGAAAGAGVAWMRVATAPWAGLRPVVHDAPNGEPAPLEVPRCVVSEKTFTFGTMGLHQKGAHAFVFRNEGNAPLRLKAGASSCSCTLSKISKSVLNPGESVEVNIEWTTKDWPEEYRQTAAIQTNDPQNPLVTLTIAGQVTEAVRAVPRDIDFGSIADGEAVSREVRLYAYLDKPLEINGWKISEPLIARYFDVTWTPLTPPDLEDATKPTSGVQAAITVKPGLPQGAFLQTITLDTNQEAAPRVELLIHGIITSDIGIVGRGWDPGKGLLTLGSIRASAGVEHRLLLVVRGPHRKDVRFTVEQATPDGLEAEVGEPKPIGDGAVLQAPLLIRIPKGARTVNCMGAGQGDFGRIRLKTNHPTAPEIVVLVRYLVEGG